MSRATDGEATNDERLAAATSHSGPAEVSERAPLEPRGADAPGDPGSTTPDAERSPAGGGGAGRRFRAALITAAVVMIGVLVALVVLLVSGDEGRVRLTTASLVPADAGIFIALNSDLSSSEWIAAFELVERLGQEDPEQRLREEAMEGGEVDWERDVAPFLGGDAAFYLRGFAVGDLEALGGFAFQGAVIVRANDAERAMQVIQEQSDAALADGSYLDVAFRFNEDEELYVAQLGEHIVAAPNRESLFEVIDVSRGVRPSLAESPQFRTLRDDLPKDFVSFLFINIEELTSGLLPSETEEARNAFAEAGLDDLFAGAMAGIVRAGRDGFFTEFVVAGESPTTDPTTRPRRSRFARLVPEATAVFFSTAGIGESWRLARDENDGALDEFIAEGSEFRDLDEALETAGEALGLDSLEEIIELLSGELAVALWFPGGDTDEVEVLVLAEVDSEVRAQSVLERVTSALELSTRRIDVGGNKVVFLEIDGGLSGEDGLAYSIGDGYLAIGTAGAVVSVVESPGAVLADSAAYDDVVELLKGPLGTFVYFDLPALLRLSGSGLPADLDEAAEALGGLLINLVKDGDVSRVSGVLSVPE